MDDRFVLATRPAKPEDVLAIFQDALRLSGLPLPNGDAAPVLELTEDTPVEEWRALMRHVWPGASPAVRLGNWFDVHAPAEEWDRVLQPLSPLRDVCELIAQHARLPVIRPTPMFGGSSDAVGAFLAVRELMRRARMEVDDLFPSSPLAPFLQQNGELVRKLILLAPGRLPAARRVEPGWTSWLGLAWPAAVALSTAWVVVSVVAVGFGAVHGWGAAPWLSLLGGTACLLAATLGQRHLPLLLPHEIRLGELTTFRDLSYALVCRRRVAPRRSA